MMFVSFWEEVNMNWNEIKSNFKKELLAFKWVGNTTREFTQKEVTGL